MFSQNPNPSPNNDAMPREDLQVKFLLAYRVLRRFLDDHIFPEDAAAPDFPARRELVLALSDADLFYHEAISMYPTVSSAAIDMQVNELIHTVFD
ncbi:hypothetical protein PCASD_20067 [Puccinia coronata f. sp. avenae]|uniref:Uncharacterized protein n=1 Tax=Puccinia coronata f. sp. avenae TaxID=200324 RepID=A0A2N5TTM8_9BASI|nr:hypothetical protein PCASD_20067 [Puccinia coronata f. sp. avenae]